MAELSYKCPRDDRNIVLSEPIRGVHGLDGVFHEEGNEGLTVQARKGWLMVVDSHATAGKGKIAAKSPGPKALGTG